jgi:glycosyltransferase involved in cell wall biosynthesis
LLRGKPIAKHLHFVWAGEGEDRVALEKEIAGSVWKNRIHLLGHRWDVADWYDAADIFVLPSHCEGMPLSIMEAMAKGLPVVASAVSGIPEELGDTGCLLPDPGRDSQGAVDALAEILRRWAYDPVARLEKGRLGRDRARILFGEERMVRRTLTLIGVLATEEPSSLPDLLSVPA